MIIGIAGRIGNTTLSAGAGKGEVAKVLVNEFGFVRVAFADEIKRTVWRWWPNFSVEELWGPSEARSRPHPEYGGLTPRKACQHAGTEVARACDPDVWVRYGLNVAKTLLQGRYWYESSVGLVYGAPVHRPEGVVFDDMRYDNEHAGVHAAGGKTLLVIRPAGGLEGEAAAHASEGGIVGIYDAQIENNNGTLEALRVKVIAAALQLGLRRTSK